MSTNIRFACVSSVTYYQPVSTSVASVPSYVLNLQVGFGDRHESVIIGRSHPITVYDLQVELQQRFNVPILEQNVTHNGIPLTQYPPDAALETFSIANNSFLSLWYRNGSTYVQPHVGQQQSLLTDYYTSRQYAPVTMYADGYQTARTVDNVYDVTPR
jgi:hypothetical protein